MQVQLHSNPSITVDALKSAGYAEMHELDDVFLSRELEFLGCSRDTFLVKAAEAQAFADAGYTGYDADTYPFLAMHIEVCACAAQVAADAILAEKAKYDAIVRHTERARLTAVNHISIEGVLAGIAQEIFAWRHSFGLSSTMGATLDRAFLNPSPDPTYDVVEVDADGADTLTITLPEKSLGDDMEVVVESYAPPGDPWRGDHYAAYTNPGASQDLTFTTANQYLVTIRNMPRVPQAFVVDCRRKISGVTTVSTSVAASSMTYTDVP